MKFKGHLHVHTEYSTLDGMARIEELILKSKELGLEGIAITDHGSSSGLYEAYKLGVKHGFNVLLGQEFYFESDNPNLKTGHIILIAKNEKGLENIYKLQSMAYDNVYYKPRINMEMLIEFHEGLICTTACIANPIGQLILRDEEMLAVSHIFELQSIFNDDLYIELQSATNPDVVRVNKILAKFIKEYNLKCIVTSDVHYVLKEDYEIHEVLLAMQQQKKMADKKRWKFEYNDYYLKSEEEMLKDLEGIDEEIVYNCFAGIDEILDKCRGVKIHKGNYLPRFADSPEEEDNILRLTTMKGYRNKVCARKEDSQKFAEDLEKELAVISQTGYSGYFLTVMEYAMWARENGILVGDGRGSGAGSKVAYTIGITDVNPDKYDLLFERFLTPGREPDFDIDFSDIDAVFKHLQDRYGKKNVARVGAYTKFTCKATLRKLMSVYGFKQVDVNRIIDMLPQELQFTVDDACNNSVEFTAWLNRHPEIEIPLRRFEGMVEHHSTHAGGVVICKDLTSILPVMTTSEDREKLIIAMDKKEIESLGHFKFDVLGLESLSLMKRVTDYTPKIDWHTVDYEDENIYNMLCDGDVMGVFQLANQKDKVIQQQPRCFNDLIAINALIRPGVGDWNEYLRRRKSYDDSLDLPFMKETMGLITYQEQYLLLAQHYAGWDIAFADNNIRKNKHLAEDIELKEKWLKDTGGMEDLWNDIVGVVTSGYSFNKSHAASYAIISFRTAYLKYYYPKEFLAAYLTQYVGKSDKKDKMNEAITLAKQMGIPLLTPDINISSDVFVPTDKGITFPLTSIKNVGGSVMYEINRLKPILSFSDFMERRIKKFVKRTSIETLIKGGAFDFTGKERYELLNQFEGVTTNTKLDDYIYEKEAFGFYITDTPFKRFGKISKWDSFKSGDYINTIVEISEIAVRKDKKGNDMAFVTGINENDTIRMLFFSSVWKVVNINEGDFVFVKGKKDKDSLLVNAVEVL